MKGLITLITGLWLVIPELALAVSEHGAGGHGVDPHGAGAHGVPTHGVDFSTLLWPSVNFVLYLVILRYFYVKYVPSMLRARSVQVADELRRSASELSEAQDQVQLYSKRLKDISEEKKELLERYEVESVNFMKTLLEEAKNKAERLQKDTQRQIERELEIAKKELRIEAVARAAHLARRDVKGSLTQEEDRRIRRELLRPELF